MTPSSLTRHGVISTSPEGADPSCRSPPDCGRRPVGHRQDGFGASARTRRRTALRGPSCSAATSFASRCSGSRTRTACRHTPTRRSTRRASTIRLARHARRVLAQGHSAIIDGVFAREDERDAIAALARECNVPLNGLFLVADLATRQMRIGSRRGDASDATQEVAAQQERL